MSLDHQHGKAIAAAVREALPAESPCEIHASMEIKCGDDIMHVFMMGRPPMLRLTVMINGESETYLGHSEMPVDRGDSDSMLP